MEFVKVESGDRETISELSLFASAIVKEVFDPIIGEAQNDYMIQMFQSEQSIEKQLQQGYQYYNVFEQGEKIGFLAFYGKQYNLYLSKFYLEKHFRGKGYAREMFAFVCAQAGKMGYHAITLNVNRDNTAKYVYEKLGMKVIKEEKNDIGNGFYMDDYVYGIQI